MKSGFALLAASMILVAASARAYTVVFDPGSTSSLRVVSRIDDLTISTTGFSGTFDVIFTSASFDSVQASGGHPIYDLYAGDPTTGDAVASAVVDQIITALNTTNANKVGSISANAGIFYLPYADFTDPSYVLAHRGWYPGTTGPWGNLGGAAALQRSAAAGISVSLVLAPEPATLPLLAGGLVGVRVLAQRRRSSRE